MHNKIISLVIAIVFLWQNTVAAAEFKNSSTLASQSYLQDGAFRDGVRAGARHNSDPEEQNEVPVYSLRKDIDYEAENGFEYEVNFCRDRRSRRNPKDNRKIAANLAKIEELLKDKKFVYNALGGMVDLSIPIEKIDVYEGGQGSQKQTLRVEVFIEGLKGVPQRFALKVAINRAAREGFARSRESGREEIPTLHEISSKRSGKIPSFGLYIEDLSDSDNRFYAYTEDWVDGPTAHQLMARGLFIPVRIKNLVVAYLSVMCALDTKKANGRAVFRINDEVDADVGDIRYLGISDVQPENVMFKAWPPRPEGSPSSSRSEEAVCVDIGKINYIKPLMCLQEFDRHYGKSEGTEEERRQRSKQVHKALFDGVMSRQALGDEAGRRFLEEAWDATRNDKRQVKGYGRAEARLLAESLKEYLEVLYIREMAAEMEGMLSNFCQTIFRGLAEYKYYPEDSSILESILQIIDGQNKRIFEGIKQEAEERYLDRLSATNQLRKDTIDLFTESLNVEPGNELWYLLADLSAGFRDTMDTSSVLDILGRIYHVSFMLELLGKSKGVLPFREQADGRRLIDLPAMLPTEIAGRSWAFHTTSAAEVLGPLDLNEDDVHLSLGGGPGIMNIAACLAGVKKSIYIDIAEYNLPFVVGLKGNYAWIRAAKEIRTRIRRQGGVKVTTILRLIEELKESAEEFPQPEVPPLDIILGDVAEELTMLADDSVSKVNILDFLHHLVKQGGRGKELQVLRDVLRVVRPGGMILLKPDVPRKNVEFYKNYLSDLANIMEIRLQYMELPIRGGALLFRVVSKGSVSGNTPLPDIDSAAQDLTPAASGLLAEEFVGCDVAV